jgi:hypothetical protein
MSDPDERTGAARPVSVTPARGSCVSAQAAIRHAIPPQRDFDLSRAIEVLKELRRMGEGA